MINWKPTIHVIPKCCGKNVLATKIERAKYLKDRLGYDAWTLSQLHMHICMQSRLTTCVEQILHCTCAAKDHIDVLAAESSIMLPSACNTKDCKPKASLSAVLLSFVLLFALNSAPADLLTQLTDSACQAEETLPNKNDYMPSCLCC